MSGGSGGSTGTQGNDAESPRPGPPPIDESIFTLLFNTLDDKAPRSQCALGRRKYNYILSITPTFAPRDLTLQERQQRATHLDLMKKSQRQANNHDIKELAKHIEKEEFKKWNEFFRKILGSMECYNWEHERTGFLYDWVVAGLRHWQNVIKKETGGTMAELTQILEENGFEHLINTLQP